MSENIVSGNTFTGDSIPEDGVVNQINISGDGESPTIAVSGVDAEHNIRIAYLDEDGDEIFSFNKPQALLNIFDDQYYLDTNPDVAEAVEGLYKDALVTSVLIDAEFKVFSPVVTDIDEAESLNIQVPENFDENNSFDFTFDFGTIEPQNRNTQISEYVASVEHYLNSGAAEGRNPSPLFDSEYYLEQNPDVATALAGGSFGGDPLLHYVSVGAAEGRDPNAYFDTDYYVEQNPDVVERDLNPLEHYVFIGSLTGAVPSASFNSSYYLSENPDVAAAGVDPLIHYLTFGQEEGRLLTA
ncbi:MAG: hypothetical protein AAGF83_27800 [Cyanobacteria bacterium P01_G01_bin.67]